MDGLGMLPRPGEPESGLEPGMSAMAGRPPRSRARPADELNAEGAVSLPLDTSIGPVALEQPASWNYDFDPGTGLSRATFSGEVSFASGGSATAGVTSFNTRTGSVSLTTADITGAGGAPANNPTFGGTPDAPTAAPGTNTTQIATTMFVQAALNATALVSSFNGRTGAITLSTSDVISAGGAPASSPALTGTPTAPTASQGNASSQIASTQFVSNAIAAGTVISWNGRTGAVTMSLNDVLSVGGAPIASPSFTGTPLCPTAAPGTATTQVASTAFVTNAVVGATSGVASFNTRTGAIVLNATDLTSAGGALLASPTFTGTPQAPTPSAGTNNNQIATTAFVATAFGALSPTVQSFNGRTGVVTLNLADVTSVGGAPLASPTFSGTVSAPTPTPLDNSTKVATTAFVDAALPVASTTAPLMNGTANAGSAVSWARGDHVHPTDTTRYAASNPSAYQTAAQVTASLGNYLPLTGGTISGSLVINTNFTVNNGGGMFVAQLSTASNALFQFSSPTSSALGQLYWNASDTSLYLANQPLATNLHLANDVSITPASGHNFIVTSGIGYQTGGGSWGNYSDARIKRVLCQYDNGLEAVCSLRPVVYVYKGNDTIGDAGYVMHREAAEGGKTFVGLVAQEIEGAFPEMVGKQQGTIDGVAVDDLRTMDTGPLLFALVNAVKQLAARVAALEAA